MKELASKMRNTDKSIHPMVLGGEFDDFDSFTENVAAWETDIRQLERGTLKTSLFQLVDPDMNVGGAYFSRPCLQAGAAPAGMHTFAILDGDAPPTRYCGDEWNLNRIALIGEVNGFESTSPAGFTIYTVSVAKEWLAGHCETTGLGPADMDFPSGSALMDHGPGSLSTLRSLLRSVASPGGTFQFDSLEALKSALGDEILQLACNPVKPAWMPGRLQRHALLARAKDYIEEHLAVPIRVQDVARELNVSTRTLEMVFRDLHNVTPKEYIKTSRLYAFHRALKSTGRQRVSQVAAEWGFWHMGQLARDYRARFACLPSETLKGK